MAYSLNWCKIAPIQCEIWIFKSACEDHFLGMVPVLVRKDGALKPRQVLFSASKRPKHPAQGTI
jgi:hypothetical protein